MWRYIRQGNAQLIFARVVKLRLTTVRWPLNRIISIGARNKDIGNSTQRSTACIQHVNHNESSTHTHINTYTHVSLMSGKSAGVNKENWSTFLVLLFQ